MKLSQCLGMIVVLSTCLSCNKKNQRNDIDPAMLAPRLLKDQAEMQAYLQAFPEKDYQIFEVPDLGKFYIDTNDALVKETIRNGQAWEPHVIKEIGKHVRQGTTVLDVGAHIGTLTVPLARLVGSSGRVYAFEPQKKIFRELFYNLKVNRLQNAIPLRYAIGSEPKIVSMNIPQNRMDGRAQIGLGGDRVELRTLDSFEFSNVSLIKIDVEGHEAEVLKGAQATIKNNQPVLIIEIWKKSLKVVEPILHEYQYSLQLIPGGWMDYVAIPRQKL